MLNQQFIKDNILRSAKWAESHGVVFENGFLGSSLLYYTLTYMLPAKIALVLGSGSGFVPRLVRQAQRDVPEGKFNKISRTILIDANMDEKKFGPPEYFGRDHFFKEAYPEVEIWQMVSDEAFLKLKKEKIQIDYLHIDADHEFKSSLKDFENYLSLMAPEFVLTMHDTAIDHLERERDGCVPRTIAFLRREMQKGGKYEHLEMINFNNRKANSDLYFKEKMVCCGIAIIKPKTLSLWG